MSSTSFGYDLEAPILVHEACLISVDKTGVLFPKRLIYIVCNADDVHSTVGAALTPNKGIC